MFYHVNMKISSSAFKNSEEIPIKYSCRGENINPPLLISQLPQSTESLALIVEDPDAPGNVYTHWLVWNIKIGICDSKLILENFNPDTSVVGRNSAGNISYIGPCPPFGVHHYFFRAYALDRLLPSNRELSKEGLKRQIKNPH